MVWVPVYEVLVVARTLSEVDLQDTGKRRIYHNSVGWLFGVWTVNLGLKRASVVGSPSVEFVAQGGIALGDQRGEVQLTLVRCNR